MRTPTTLCLAALALAVACGDSRDSPSRDAGAGMDGSATDGATTDGTVMNADISNIPTRTEPCEFPLAMSATFNSVAVCDFGSAECTVTNASTIEACEAGASTSFVFAVGGPNGSAVAFSPWSFEPLACSDGDGDACCGDTRTSCGRQVSPSMTIDLPNDGTSIELAATDGTQSVSIRIEIRRSSTSIRIESLSTI